MRDQDIEYLDDVSSDGFHSPFNKGTKVTTKNGNDKGILTGRHHHCRMEGCTGLRLSVKWEDGETTRPCTKGMDLIQKVHKSGKATYSWKIG